jgi:hypothetical protein
MLDRTSGGAMLNHALRINVILMAFAAIAGFSSNVCGDSLNKERVSSFHLGFLDHNGVDLAGYTVEHKLKNGLYGFYTFGFPSIAAAGISYYFDYRNNGPVATIGVGIGSVMYSSLLYQFRIADRHFVKVGAGYTTGIAYTGIFPALSYEMRFK